MPTPRGRTAHRVQPNSRAIVREAEWMVMPERIASELRPLVKLAKDQGWSIEGTNNGRLVWRGPNGEGPVYTGYRCNGRDLANYRAELIRNGLKLDEKTAKEHITEQQYEQILEENADLSLEELQELLNKVTGALAYMHAKAVAFDGVKKQAKEWQEIAEEAQAAAEAATRKLSDVSTMLDAIRETFTLAPWAILPEIAKLLGIDANGPSIRLQERTNT